MPYRFNLPENAEPVMHLHEIGTPQLVGMRSALYKLVYDAPETTISLREREAMRFPLTVVIGCPLCNSMRMWRDWPANKGCEPIPEEFYENAAAQNRDWPGFTARERLLIEFVHRFDKGIDELNGDDDYWAQMQANFSEIELGDVVLMAGVWLGFGRGLKAFGIGSVCELPTPGAVAAQGIAAE